MSSDAAVTEESLLAACRSDSIDLGMTIMTVLGNVKSCTDSMDVEGATRNIEILTNSFESLLEKERKVASTFIHAFCNAVWLLVCQNNELGNSLVSVIKEVLETAEQYNNHASQELKRALLRTVGDCKLLQTVGVIDAAKEDLPRKLRLTNTTINYRQHKFNLLSEESEGYSKFLYLLTAARGSSVGLVQTVIGTYSLDPNRCLDLSVDVLEYELDVGRESSNDSTTAASPKLQSLWKIIEALKTTGKLPQLLGFKLRGRVEAGDSDNNCESLLRCMAWMCLQGLDAVSVLSCLPGEAHFGTKIGELYKTAMLQGKQRVAQLGRVSLSSSTDDKTVKAIDLKPLQELWAIKLLHVFLDVKAFEKVQCVFQPYWSELAVLFPESVGVAILDWVQDKVTAWLEQQGSISPWSEKKSPTKTSLSLDNALDVIGEPLELVRDSGCIRFRPILFSQLCRLLTILLEKESGASNEAFLDFLRSFLVPSLSVFNPNPALSMELWKILNQLPYRSRYSLYRSWRGSGLEREALMTNKPLWLIEGEVLVGKDARYALKRMSKDTIRDMSRALAKCCHGHPLVVFTTILNQIESYDNLVQVMVDACRFVTPLSLDVLGFCILQRLSGNAGAANRSRLKENGVNTSQWLQSLESFAGAFYKRFPFIEFQGILCYLMNRLKEGHVMELGVLRTLLKSSGGWSFADYAPVASLSATQLDGRAGSTMLKRETMAFGVVDDINLRASNEVRNVLQTDDMGVSLLILLAQVRHDIVFKSSSGPPKPVKLIANLVDTCQVVSAILLDFLTNTADARSSEGAQNSTPITKYAQSLPSLLELCHDYKVDVASAWMLCRPLVRVARSAGMASGIDDGADPLSAFKPTKELRKAYTGLLPPSAWAHLSVNLFESFYTNTLYDFVCPEDVYLGEIARLERDTERLSLKKNAPPPETVQPGAPPEKTDREELERLKKAAVALSTDCATQKEHVTLVRVALASNASEFFVSKEVSREAAMTFLACCIYPRCMQGPDDALFCAHFVSFLHKKEAPGFSTLHFFDALIVTLSRSLFCLTEGEAACASILLLETWKTVSKWRYDDSAFEAELAGKVGSFMVVTDDNDTEAHVAVSKEEYTHLYNKWHASIGATCIGCLKSSEYMHRRNCLVVLSRMVDVYPTRPKLANKLLQVLEPLQEESNALADIRASCQAYSMQLIRARDGGVWKEEDAATVKARQEQEVEAAAKRHKQAEAQMAEIMRDSEQITDEIGEWDSRDRSRGRAGGHNRGDKQYEHDDRRRLADERRGAGIRPPPLPRDPTQHIPPQGGDRWQSGRGASEVATGSYNTAIGGDAQGGNPRRADQGSRARPPPQPTQQSEEGRGLQGRWQRAGERDTPGDGRGGGATSRKRSHPSSPDQGETRDEPQQQQQTKRARTSGEEEGGRWQGGGHIRKRPGGGGGSSNRR